MRRPRRQEQSRAAMARVIPLGVHGVKRVSPVVIGEERQLVGDDRGTSDN
jgi:hypothetical protein